MLKSSKIEEPVDDDISADIYFEEEHTDTVEFQAGMHTYELSVIG